MNPLYRRLLAIGLAAGMLPAAAIAAPSAVAKDPLTRDPLGKERAYFARTAREPGVAVLPGLAYKLLKSGPADGEHPGRSDTVTVHYIGKLTDGTQFDASGGDGTGEASFKVSDVIAGFSAALKLMRPGDQWRIYIPAYLAYGDQAKPKIPPGSTLVFDLELVSIAPRS